MGGFSFNGPFELGEAGELPRVDVEYTQKANGQEETVRLVYNPVGIFGDGQDQDVSLLGIYFSSAANELQLTLQAPLGPGSYKIIVLGGDAGLPLGQTYTSTFCIAVHWKNWSRSCRFQAWKKPIWITSPRAGTGFMRGRTVSPV